MNILKLILLCSLIITPHAFAQEEDCDTPAIPLPAREFVSAMAAVTNGLYKDVSSLKVNLDGEGKLSVFFENGKPKLLKMTYKNGKGSSSGQKTFDDLEKGNPLVYENKDKPGNAIILERGETFQKNGKYSLILKVRSGLNPEKHTSYPIEFDANVDSPKLSSNGKDFKSIVISPGVSMFSWDGTFKKVEFK